MSMWTCHCRFN